MAAAACDVTRAICWTVLVTLPVSEVARDRNDDTPLWGEVGALVCCRLLLPFKFKVIGAVAVWSGPCCGGPAYGWPAWVAPLAPT